MADGKRYDDPEIQKFADENREMIEKILAQEKAREEAEAKARMEACRKAYEEDMAYEQEMRARRDAQRRYEAAMAREERAAYMADHMERTARDAGERAYDSYLYARSRTEDALGEGRDRTRAFLRDRADYAYDAACEERDRLRARMEEERRYFYDAMDDGRAKFREDRERLRKNVNEDLSDTFGFFADPKFQQHLVGAGLEMWMAFNSLLKSSSAPEFMKDFMSNADRNKNVEYCRKNEYCRSKKNPDAPRNRDGGLQPIAITPSSEKEETDGEKDGGDGKKDGQ